MFESAGLAVVDEAAEEAALVEQIAWLEVVKAAAAADQARAAMPHTLAALESGAPSEWRATLIVLESVCLSIEDRRTLDAQMCADVTALDGKGDARITADAKSIAYRLDPRAVVERAAKAAAERTVTIRPAPDNMTYVTVLSPCPSGGRCPQPVQQGVRVHAALKQAVGVMP